MEYNKPKSAAPGNRDNLSNPHGGQFDKSRNQPQKGKDDLSKDKKGGSTVRRDDTRKPR